MIDVYEIYQPLNVVNENHIHVIGVVERNNYRLEVSSIYYIFPDDKFIKQRTKTKKFSPFQIEERFIRKLKKEEALKYLI